MKLTVSCEDNVVQLDVYEDMELENLIAYCEAELGVPFNNMKLVHNAIPLLDIKKTLKQLGVVDGDMMLAVSADMLQQATQQQLSQQQQQQQQPPPHSNLPSRFLQTAGAAALAASSSTSSSSQAPSSSSSRLATADNTSTTHSSMTSQAAASLLESQFDTKEITLEEASKVRDSFLSSPTDMTNLKLSNMPLADALASGSLDEFHKVLKDQHKRRCEDQRRKIRMLTADPFDVETQKMIAEEIQRQQIETNMQDAIEFMPEAFGQVHMLYIKCKVNGTPIDAFVDSGAQSTIMSKACADRCNVTRLLDTRWSGIAQGVGTQKILGRIHMCQVQIESDFFPSSFNVLEQQPMDMLLGLDMLKRHQCVIDLKHNLLRIGTTGTETKFLNENELPKHAKNHH